MGAEVDVSASEAAIAARLTARDFAGAATLAIAAYGPEILKYLRALLRDPVAADEAFSQFGENLWRGIEKFAGASAFRTWAYRVATNAAHDYRRDGFRKRGRALETGELSRVVADVHTRTPYFQQTRAREDLAELVAALDDAQRQLLALRIENRLPWAEVAEVLSIDVGAAKKRFERLRQKLATLMADRRGDP